MSRGEAIVVRGEGELRGKTDLPPEEWARAGQVPVRLEQGGEVLVPPALLQRQADGSYYLPLSADEVGRRAGEHFPMTIPVAQERLHVGKREVETGKVVVQKTVTERQEVADLPLMEETVEVRRVPVGRIVDGPVPVREEGDEVIVPVLEEVLVVEKKLRLKEEVHLVRRRTETHRPQTVTLRGEQVEVERAGGPGAPTDGAQ